MAVILSKTAKSYRVGLSLSIATETEFSRLERLLKGLETNNEISLVIARQEDPNLLVTSRTARQIIFSFGELKIRGFVIKYVGLQGKFKRRLELDGTYDALDTYETAEEAEASYSAGST